MNAFEFKKRKRLVSISYWTDDTIGKRFTGYQHDGETGLEDAVSRCLETRHGRFTQVDPYNIIFEKDKGRDESEKDRIFINFIADPQIWNRYSYVVNNPLKYSDPDGRRPQTKEESRNLERLRELARVTTDNTLQKEIYDAVDRIEAAIAASRDKESDPRGLKIALWAIDKLHDRSYGRKGGPITFKYGDMSVTYENGEYKCNLFVVQAQADGGGIPLGTGGIPITWTNKGLGYFTNSITLPSANDWASMEADGVPSYELMASPQMGDVTAWANAEGSGHSGISLGGNLTIYAGEEYVKVQTIQYVASPNVKNTNTVFRRKKE